MQIIKEVRKATAPLKGSVLEDDAVGDGIPNEDQVGPAGDKVFMKKMLDTKINKNDLTDFLKDKSSKKDLEVVMRQI
jgi:hypothetical protein